MRKTNAERETNVRRRGAVALALAAALMLAGCGSASTGGGTQVQGTDSTAPAEQEAAQEAVAEPVTASAPEEAAEVPGEPVSVRAIYDAIGEAVTLPAMYEADDDFLMNYYGIDASLLKEYVFASCEDAARVDSVILMCLKDEADAQSVADGLDGLLSQMEAEMDNYNPEAHELVTAASVRRHGDLMDLVISADRERILSVIDGLIG